jgi:hypothetical protein
VKGDLDAVEDNSHSIATANGPAADGLEGVDVNKDVVDDNSESVLAEVTRKSAADGTEAEDVEMGDAEQEDSNSSKPTEPVSVTHFGQRS